MTLPEREYWPARSGLDVSPEGLAGIVATAADIALVVAPDDRVRSVVVNPLNGVMEDIANWEGKRLHDIVDPDSRDGLDLRLRHLRGLLDDGVEAGGPGVAGAGPIEINHSEVEGWTFPVRYTLHPTGHDGLILMLGRDLRPVADLQSELVRAQLQLERDHDAQRVIETRYRAMLEATPDPVLLIDGNLGRVIDLNRIAARRLGPTGNGPAPATLTQVFEGQRDDLLDALRDLAAHSAEETGRTTIELRSRHAGRVSVTACAFRVMGERLIVCRVVPSAGESEDDDPLGTGILALFHKSPDPIVVVGRDMRVLAVNTAFAETVGLSSPGLARDRPLAGFLARGGLDERVIRLGDCPRDFGVRLVTQLGGRVPAMATVTDLGELGLAVVLRTGSAVTATGAGKRPDEAELVSQVTASASELVGALPLRDIVASLADVVEKRCVETAVELTDNNRVAAAEMLGLSRQSLYVKLRKYGLLTRQDR